MRQFVFPAWISADLAQVADLIRDRFESQQAVLQAARGYLIGSDSDQLRAALTLISTNLGEQVDQRMVHAAAAIELIQQATQIHTSLVDDAERRQNQVAAENWSGDVPLMIGDYLFALAASEMALAPDPRIIDYFSRAVMTITEGKLMPVLVAKPFVTARKQYIDMAGATTASLFAAACKAGMVGAGGDANAIAALGRYGYAVGLAYAITAELLDTTSQRLRSGVITLPLIYAIEAGAAQLAAIINTPPADDATIAVAVQAIDQAGGNLRALADAEDLAAQAIAELAQLPASRARTALEDLARSLSRL